MVVGKIKTNRKSCTLNQDNRKDALRISQKVEMQYSPHQ